MKEILDLFKNVSGGPMTTIIGAIFFGLGGITIWKTYQSANTVTWVYVEVGLFVIGAFLLFKSDEWLKSLFKKK